MLAHSRREGGLLRAVHTRPAGGGIAMTVGTTGCKTCRMATSAIGRSARGSRIIAAVRIIVAAAAGGDITVADSQMLGTGVWGRVRSTPGNDRFKDTVDMQRLVDKDVGVAVAAGVDICMTAAGTADAGRRESGRDIDAARMAGCGGGREAVAGAAGCCGDGRRQ